MNEEDIDYFNSLSYSVLLKKNGSFYTLCIPELSCVVEDSDIAAAYEKLEQKKKEIFQDMISSDLVESIQRPQQVKIREELFRSLYPFMVKTAVVCGVIFFASLATIYVVHDSIKQLAPSGPVGLLKSQATQVKHGLDNMTEDEKRDLRLKIRATLIEIKPFMDEFKVLWQEPVQIKSAE